MSALTLNRRHARQGRLMSAAADAASAPRRPAAPRAVYLALLGWAFALFNSIRLLSYLPTMWAIHASGDSSQHSLITWATWLGANLTMALWLREHHAERRFDRAACVSLGNAAMCLATLVLIGWHRF